MKIKDFFIRVGQGAAIGVSMIIPGVSGGTMAVLMNVYDKLISAISNLRKDFKNSFFFLLPIVIGALLAVCAMFFPIKYALKYAPFPTVMLFTGLMLGTAPKLFKEGIKKGFKKLDIIAILVPLAVVIGICFIPNMGNADLSTGMPVWGYFVLILIGAVASCALVVPGISGSLLLLIFGYYNSILDTVSALKTSFGHSVLVLFLFVVGLVIGFFSIAKLMKLFLSKFPRATFWAIIGFVIGSFPAIFLTYNGNFPDNKFITLDSIQIALGVIFLAAGAVASYFLTAYVESRLKKQAEQEAEPKTSEPEQNTDDIDGE
ncbi:MAG: DUF368 domain-containing protein [Clostridia bacterium]|nr:DUF368 domain-containing protein [Clostridia bacterium]